MRGYVDPPYMIMYLYNAFWKPPNFRGVNVDPRGNFTHLRLAAIITLDKFMLTLHVGKPLIEACEFLANYPVW